MIRTLSVGIFSMTDASSPSFNPVAMTPASFWLAGPRVILADSGIDFPLEQPAAKMETATRPRPKIPDLLVNETGLALPNIPIELLSLFIFAPRRMEVLSFLWKKFSIQVLFRGVISNIYNPTKAEYFYVLRPKSRFPNLARRVKTTKCLSENVIKYQTLTALTCKFFMVDSEQKILRVYLHAASEAL